MRQPYTVTTFLSQAHHNDYDDDDDDNMHTPANNALELIHS